MLNRFDKVFEERVTKALKLSLNGDYFGAVMLMKEQGISNNVIALALYQQHQTKSSDLFLIEQLI